MSDCIFCKIAAGKIPADKVYEDDKMVAFRDLEPAAPTHVLLVPKAHAANVTEADPALVGYMLGKAGQIAAELGIREKGFRLVINTGEDGGQTVQHLHTDGLASVSAGKIKFRRRRDRIFSLCLTGEMLAFFV